jgi:hypothetical protein
MVCMTFISCSKSNFSFSGAFSFVVFTATTTVPS